MPASPADQGKPLYNPEEQVRKKRVPRGPIVLSRKEIRGHQRDADEEIVLGAG